MYKLTYIVLYTIGNLIVQIQLFVFHSFTFTIALLDHIVPIGLGVQVTE